MDSDSKFIAKVVGFGFLALIVIITILSLNPFRQIETGEVGIVMRLGKIDRVLSPGLHYKTPWIEDVVVMDTTLQKTETVADAATSDKQQAITNVAVNFRIDETAVETIWSSLRNDYVTRVIDPTIQEAVKKVTARYTIDELLEKRDEIKAAITESIRTTAEKNHIIVTEVYITNFKFSDRVNQSIEETAKAKQDALKAQQDLARVQFEAEQKVANAEAEAEAIRLASQAANNPRYVELKQLEVQLEFAKKWNGQLPQNLYASAPLPILDILK